MNQHKKHATTTPSTPQHGAPITLRSTLIALTCLSLTACIPTVTDIWDTGFISGQLLHADTGEPIIGAQISHSGHPKTAIPSDELGNFALAGMSHLEATLIVPATSLRTEHIDIVIEGWPATRLYYQMPGLAFWPAESALPPLYMTPSINPDMHPITPTGIDTGSLVSAVTGCDSVQWSNAARLTQGVHSYLLAQGWPVLNYDLAAADNINLHYEQLTLAWQTTWDNCELWREDGSRTDREKIDDLEKRLWAERQLVLESLPSGE